MKSNKKLINIQEKLDECKDMNKYKLYGELITFTIKLYIFSLNLPNES